MAKYTKEHLMQELTSYYEETNNIPNSRTFHIHQNVYRYHFGNWNNALRAANVPTYTGTITHKCKKCGKDVTSRISQSKQFCNRSCSASYYNKIRPKRSKQKRSKQKRSKQNKPKPLTEYQQWKLSISGPYVPLWNCKCKHCDIKFLTPTKRKYCNIHKELYSTPNRDRYRFQFNVFHFPDLFDTSSILNVGFYDGGKQSQHKITRDHRISVVEAIKNNYDPYYITHPLNCELMTWAENYKKRTKCSLKYTELVSLVDAYEFKNTRRGSNP